MRPRSLSGTSAMRPVGLRDDALPGERGGLLRRDCEPKVLEWKVARAALDDDSGQVRYRCRDAIDDIAIRERIVYRELVGIAIEQKHRLAELSHKERELPAKKGMSQVVAGLTTGSRRGRTASGTAGRRLPLRAGATTTRDYGAWVT